MALGLPRSRRLDDDPDADELRPSGPPLSPEALESAVECHLKAVPAGAPAADRSATQRLPRSGDSLRKARCSP